MDRRVMVFVCPLIIKLLVTLWALDHLQLGGPNISWAITTTSCCNAVLRLRITYEVAPMDHTMFPIWISAYNNFSIVLPSVDFTMEELRLARFSTILTCGHVFPQAMGTPSNLINVFAVPERRFRKSVITCIKHLLNVLFRICFQSAWNHFLPCWTLRHVTTCICRVCRDSAIRANTNA